MPLSKMDDVQVIEVREDVLASNDQQAKDIRKKLRERGVYFLNVMSSPGSGKTTLLTELIKRLQDKYKVGVIEADIDSDVDAATIADETAAGVIQMHTGGACHVTSKMAQQALRELGVKDYDVIILENIGNLVCPAEFDTGATQNLVLISVPEGDDKPLKYPLMFEVASVVAITKEDTSPAFDCSPESVEDNIRTVNSTAPIFHVAAIHGEGMNELTDYIVGQIERCKANA